MALLASVLLLAGCSGGTSASTGNPSTDTGLPAAAQTLKELGKDEKATVKVLYYDKNAFLQQYGNLFMAKFPNIDLEVISTQSVYSPGKDYRKEFRKLVETEKPDVLLLQSADQLGEFASDGKLFALDDVIKQDKFDIDQIDPAVIELVKSSGNGKIYGLSPTFYSNAIYYNKDLFEKYGVPLPKDQMSWDEVLQLAKRFPADGKGADRVYGLSAYSYAKESMGFYYMSGIGSTMGLRTVDPDSMNVTMNTDGWKQALRLTADALKSGALYAPASDKQDAKQPLGFEDYLKSNPFVAGQAAMTIDGSYLMDNLQRAKEVVKDYKPFNWDLVTVPVDPQNPNVSNSVSVSNLFAVSAAASNTRAAWELVKYLNSDEMAKIRSKSSNELLTRTAYMKEKDGHRLEPFYKLKPSDISLYKGSEKIPSNFYQPFTQLAGEEIMSVVDGKKTVDDALKSMQERGQAALIKAKQEQDAQKEQDAKDTAGK
jgi:multiple sugar transport system substrate-binding protein